jgi:hypothetical protein
MKKTTTSPSKKKPSRTTALRKADTAFSLYIRTRDAQPWNGKFFRCISCGRILPIEKADCGHYINRQHMSLRFSEINCNAQCAHCNRFDEGNTSGYRQHLVAIHGEEKVLLLESQKHATNRLTAFDLEMIAQHYRQEVKKFPHQIK